jgi:hypothetical protein
MYGRPIAPVVLCVILVIGVLMHTIGLLDAAATPFTVIVPLAFTEPQTPDNGIL